jgi:drug/metabolite transporter (DMT)-like permease
VNLGDADPDGRVLMIGSSLSRGRQRLRPRNVHGLAPMIPALFQVTFAAAIVIPIALLVDRPFATVTLEPSSIAAVLWLGLLGSGLAYIAYFTVLRAWGATRTSMVAYLLPVVGIVLGAVVLNDPVTANRIGAPC